MPVNDSFHIYDTTLRDGAQQEGLNLSVHDKMNIARHLDDLGVGFIEGGWPGARHGRAGAAGVRPIGAAKRGVQPHRTN